MLYSLKYTLWVGLMTFFHVPQVLSGGNMSGGMRYVQTGDVQSLESGEAPRTPIPEVPDASRDVLNWILETF